MKQNKSQYTSMQASKEKAVFDTKQNKNLYLIGVTGGVGAGKSAILSILKEEYGAYVIQADEVGHRLRKPGESIYCWMLEEYGEGILLPDGTIHSAAVAGYVFSDAEKLQKLNAVVHPKVREAIIEEINTYKDSLSEDEKGLVVIEAALLKEGKLSELCDEVWYVYAPADERIRRLIEGRGYSRERCEDIMGRQKTEEQFRAETDLTIDNSQGYERTRKQIAEAIGQWG